VDLGELGQTLVEQVRRIVNKEIDVANKELSVDLAFLCEALSVYTVAPNAFEDLENLVSNAEFIVKCVCGTRMLGLDIELDESMQ
jgi:hypothetical protein